MVPAILNDADQTLPQPVVSILGRIGLSSQLLNIFRQQDRPGEGDQRVVTGRLTGMSFLARHFGTGKNQPATLDTGLGRVKLYFKGWGTFLPESQMIQGVHLSPGERPGPDDSFIKTRGFQKSNLLDHQTYKQHPVLRAV